MNLAPTFVKTAGRILSEEGRERLRSQWGEPLFLAGWERTLFVHYEVPVAQLQRDVPFELDLHDGRAYISLVAFTMRNMRFRFGGPVLSWWLKPIATHSFLNVRTYVRQSNERGIYFLTEWLSNWLSAQLGPLLYGLPYHYAGIDYQHEHENGHLRGRVEDGKARCHFEYEAECEFDVFAGCEDGSLDEFLIERYTAFTARGLMRRFFRIWHPPWPQTKVKISVQDDSLLRRSWTWFPGARLVGANYSPGFAEVWMGRAHRVK